MNSMKSSRARIVRVTPLRSLAGRTYTPRSSTASHPDGGPPTGLWDGTGRVSPIEPHK